MRVPIVAANWKMFKTLKEAESFVLAFKPPPELLERVEILLFPPFTALQTVGEAIKDRGIRLGAQNMHPAAEGAYTGEISPRMLKDLGCSDVLVGHSERRHIFKESNLFINEKVKTALQHGLRPIICVGETLEEREAGKTHQICREQLLDALKGVTLSGPSLDVPFVVAYEPVWAIGTGKNAHPTDAEEVISYLRELLRKKYGTQLGEVVRILYGGSVKPNNIVQLMGQKNLDGALVGGASLEPDLFYKIAEGAKKW